MIYLYPKLSENDCLLFRFGGAGLGNILFVYARAIVYARDHSNCKVIWPTWPSFKVGPYIRHEKDKRFYGDLFLNKSGYIKGINKARLIISKKKIPEKDLLSGKKIDNCIVTFTGFEDCFSPIINDSKYVKNDLIRNLKSKNRKALAFNGKKTICVHVRLGDFSRVSWDDVLAGKNCSSIPIEWYVTMVNEIRRITGQETKVYVFSDGTDEELIKLLSLENTERISFGTSIADILALSKAGILIASGSSFSMWARYLGRMTTIMFPNQVKQIILQEDEESKEITAIDHINDEYIEIIKKALL